MRKFIIGLGSFPYKKELENVLPRASTLGFDFVDTSDDYFNEDYVGDYVRDNNFKVFTKFSFVDQFKNFEQHFNDSKIKIEKNGTELYCYLLHWPYPFLYKKLWYKMEELYLSGKVKEIGVCNFTEKQLMKLMKNCRVKPMYNEIELHPLFQQKDTVEFCEKNDIQIISYSPFARIDKRLFENTNLINISERENTSIANIILKWNINKGYIPIPSTSKEHHLKEMELDKIKLINLDKDDMKIIDSLECNGRIRFNPDTYFSFKTKIKFLLISLGLL